MKKTLNVLLVEDKEDDAILIENELRRGGLIAVCKRVDTAGQMNQAVLSGSWDVIICDFSLPRFSGVLALEYAHRAGLDVPFIIVSGTISEDTAVAAMKAGAHDYVMKNNLARLVPAIRRELREAEKRKALRAAKDKLNQGEQYRMIGEQMSALIHDLSGPLEKILGLAARLRSDDLTEEKRARHLGTIEREIEMIVGMRDDFTDFTQGSLRIAHETVDLDRMVMDVEEDYAPACAASGIALVCSSTSVPGHTLVFKGDRLRIWRVFQNLIANARDAMPSGGRIVVEVKSTEDGVFIEVSDNGPGIPEELQEALFKPTVTGGKRRGMGFGLAIVKRIVEAHEGSLTFVSDPLVGTTFTLWFPRSISRTFEQYSPPSLAALS